MINWLALAPQVRALAGHEALRQAQLGRLPWTGALAREHNGRWLKDSVPARLARQAGLVEEGQCECGGVCLIVAADEQGLYHRCTACRAVYRVAWNHYKTDFGMSRPGRPESALPDEAGTGSISNEGNEQ